jgi:Fe-S-cluster containining protein
MNSAETKWYKDGVRFSCLPACTQCCRGEPGDVFVSPEEIQAIAALLNANAGDFEALNVHHYSSGKMSLKELRNGDCVLLRKNGCSAYSVRPKQCRDYPFWPEIFVSEAAWLRETRRCPGINTGTLFTAAEITKKLESQK